MTDAHHGFDGKVALITGGSSRIGRAIAYALAKAGMDIGITFHSNERTAAEVVQQIDRLGRRACAIEADLSRPECDEMLFRCFGERFSRCDALINNASVFYPSPLGQLTPMLYDRAMAINARAPLMLIQRFKGLLGAHFEPRDPASPGRVVNLVDIHVLGEPLKDFAAYNASKAALLEITATCAVDLAPRITVNAVAPGVVGGWSDFHSPEQRRQFMARVPMDREGRPEEVARTVLYLVGDASYCTGQIIKVDGGRSLT